jgi:hypothetical protein
MALPQSPTTPIDYDTFPNLVRSSTAPVYLNSPRPDRSRLAPEDAFYANSPPRPLDGFQNGSEEAPDTRQRRMRLGADASRSRSRRRKRTWKKLLWVKQSCEFSSRWSYAPVLSMEEVNSDEISQIRITTRTKRPFSRTSSGIPGCSRTTSGPWSPTAPSSCSMCAPS